MANSIIHNRKNLSISLHADANTTWTIAGNSSVSDIATGDEVLTGASIKQVWFGSSSGNGMYWVVKRGSNTIGVYDSTGWKDYSGNGNMINKDSSGTLVVELNNTGNGSGYIMIELQKEGIFDKTY